MKALLLHEPGPVSTLTVGDVPEPEPGPGEIRVRVAAMGLNPVDYKLAARGHGNWTYPHILGLDVAGTVEAVGDGVDTFAAGDLPTGPHGERAILDLAVEADGAVWIATPAGAVRLGPER